MKNVILYFRFISNHRILLTLFVSWIMDHIFIHCSYRSLHLIFSSPHSFYKRHWYNFHSEISFNFLSSLKHQFILNEETIFRMKLYWIIIGITEGFNFNFVERNSVFASEVAMRQLGQNKRLARRQLTCSKIIY